MGKFGPGTKSDIHVKSNNWKVAVGAIENKNRPEGLYIVMSSWITPKMTIMKAQSTATSEPEALAVEIIKNFGKEVERAKRGFGGYFDSTYFDTASLIVTYEIAASQAKPGKPQFFELEINLDTVNDIDFNGNPAPGSSGKINTIPFKDFIATVTKSINKILDSDIFNDTKASVTFAKVKKG